MSEAVNLKRARIVEFTSGPRMTAVRTKRGDPFRIVALDSNPDPATALPNDWDETGVERYGKDVNVLAEFPITLSDLIPEGCTRFECADDLGSIRMARRQESGKWAIAGHHPLPDLISLQERYKLNPRTFIPLAVHPQYVEERR